MRICWPQILFLLLVIVLGIGSMLSGCGKKGPLYLPDEPESTRQAS
jgi:predicted small lipoprotein YifL